MFIDDVLKHKGFLIRFAKRLDPPNMDDLFQATLLRVIEKQHTYQTDMNLRGWLGAMMYHIFINDLRRIRRSQRINYDWCKLVTTGSSPPDAQLYAKEVIRASEELGESYSSLLSLVTLGDSYDEIRDKLLIAKGTVHSRIYRGREKLAARVGWVRGS